MDLTGSPWAARSWLTPVGGSWIGLSAAASAPSFCPACQSLAFALRSRVRSATSPAMSRAWSMGLVVFAAIAMWLAVGWPGREESKTEPGSPEHELAAADPGKPKGLPAVLPPRLDAAAPEPEEQEPQPPPAPAPPLGPAPWPQGDILAGDRGPVAEYRAQYEREARDAKATDVEGAVRTAFGHSKRPDLLHSTSCHENICRVLIRWSPDRANDYIQSVRWLALGTSWPPGQPGFESRLAIASGSESDKDGGRIVELYLKRRSPELARPH